MPQYNESVTDKIRNLMGEAGNTAKTIASHIDNKNGTSLASKQVQLQRAQYLQSVDNSVYSVSAKKALTGIESMLYGNSKTGEKGFFANQLNDTNYDGYDASTQAMLANTLNVEYLTKNFGMTEAHATKFIGEYGDTITEEATQRTQTNRWMSMAGQLGADQQAYSKWIVAKGGTWSDVSGYLADHYKESGGKTWDVTGEYDPSKNEVKLGLASELGIVNAKIYIDNNITNPDIRYEDLLDGAVNEWITVLTDADDGTSDFFKSLKETSKDDVKIQVAEYIRQQSAIALAISEDKRTPVREYLVEAQLAGEPVTYERLMQLCKEAGLDPTNTFDKSYIDSTWLSQKSLNLQYEAKAEAEEQARLEQEKNAKDAVTIQEAEALGAKSDILYAKGEYDLAYETKVESIKKEWQPTIDALRELGLEEDAVRAEGVRDSYISDAGAIRDIKKEEHTRAEAEKEQEAQNIVDSLTASNYIDRAEYFESLGYHKLGATYRADASDIQYDIQIQALKDAGASPEAIKAAEEQKASARTHIEQTGATNQTLYDKEQKEKAKSEQASFQNTIDSAGAKKLELEADQLELEKDFKGAGEKMVESSNLSYDILIRNAENSGASPDEIESLYKQKSEAADAIRGIYSKKQTDYNAELAKQDRVDTYNRIASFVSDFSSDIKKTIIANPEGATDITIGKDGVAVINYKHINEDGTITEANTAIDGSISELMFKNGEGVTSVSTAFWPVIKEYGQKVGVINPDGTIADHEGLIILTSCINKVADEVPNKYINGTASGEYHTDSYARYMAVFEDPSASESEVADAYHREAGGMTKEEQQAIAKLERNTPALTMKTTLVDRIKAEIGDIASTSTDKKNINSSHAIYVLGYDVAFNDTLYSWCNNHPTATTKELEEFSKQVAVDLLQNEFYLGLENEIELGFNFKEIYGDVGVSYVDNANVDTLYSMYVNEEIPHMIRADVLSDFKVIMGGNSSTFSNEKDLYDAMSSALFKEEDFDNLGSYEKSIVLANSAVLVKEVFQYNNCKSVPESVGVERKTSEIFVEGYGIAAIDEVGTLYLYDGKTNSTSMVHVGKNVYDSVMSGQTWRINVDESLPVSKYTKPEKPVEIDGKYGYEDIYDIYNENPLEGKGAIAIINDSKSSLKPVDFADSIGSPYKIYNTGNGADSGVAGSLGIIPWLKNNVFGPVVGTPAEKKEKSNVDINLIAQLEQIEGGK